MNHSKLDCFALSDVGLKRQQNEDQFLVADLVKAARVQQTSLSLDRHTEVTGQTQGKVFLVADGVGGRVAGSRASAVAVDEMVNFMVNRMGWQTFQESHRGMPDALAGDLKAAMKHCQERIQNEAMLNADKHGMATTLTVALLDWPFLHVVHVGDSRCYLHRTDHLRQLTCDHTFAQTLVQEGAMTSEEARESRLNNAIWNVVGGTSSDIEPELFSQDLLVDDTLLLCTDGLTKHVTDSEIAELLGSGDSAKDIANRLVDLANANGGTDNITVVVARFLSNSDDLVKDTGTCVRAESDETVTLPQKSSIATSSIDPSAVG